MKLLLPVALLLGLSASAQSTNLAQVATVDTSGRAQLTFIMDDDCSRASILAERDIRANAPFLLVASGIAPVVYTSDAAFEGQFRVRYFDEGCTGPSRACLMTYNQRVFNYLQATYGKRWQRVVRKDVVGLKEWRRKH
jgi:hypothetical protein